MIRHRHYIKGRRNAGTALSEPSTIPPTGFGSTYNQYLWQRQNTADAKIGVIAAANLAFVALFVPNVPPVVVKSPLLTTFLFVIYILAIILFSLSIIVSFIAFYPQEKPEQDKKVLFWRSILAMSTTDYDIALKKKLKNSQAVEDAYIEENHRVCQNFAGKNRLLQWSIRLFAGGSFVALASLISKYFVH
jgi:Family of unknown function (DUF5706)